MMLDRECIRPAQQVVSRDSFYFPAHATIYDAVAALHDRGSALDALTVREELARRRQLQSAGGTEYLAAVVNSVGSAAHGVAYARVVADLAERRQWGGTRPT